MFVLKFTHDDHTNILLSTGLDPADATWDFNEPDTSLDMSDAIFVDIMHTNGGNMSNGGIAFIEPFGHADFYVNGGRIQPGCTTPDNCKS